MNAFPKFNVQAYMQNQALGNLGSLGLANTQSQLSEIEQDNFEERKSICIVDGCLSENEANQIATAQIIDMRAYFIK